MANIMLGGGNIAYIFDDLRHNCPSSTVGPEVMPIKIRQADLFARLHDDMPILLPADRPPDALLAPLPTEPQGNIRAIVRAHPLANSVHPLLQQGFHLRQDQQMPLGRGLALLRLAPPIVKRAFRAVARLAVVVRPLRGRRGFGLAAL